MESLEVFIDFFQHNWVLNLGILLISIFFLLLFRKFHSKVLKKNLQERLIYKNIYLKADLFKIHEWSKSHINFLNNNHKKLLETYSPIILYNKKEHKNEILFPKGATCKEIQDIFELWESGYYFPQFILLFAIYLRSRNIPQWQKKVIQLSTYKDIHDIQKFYLYLYFHDILPVTKEQNFQKKIINLQIIYRDSIYFTKSLQFSLELNDPNIKWTRKIFYNYIVNFLNFQDEKQKNYFISLICDLIQQKPNSILKSYIVLKYREKYNFDIKAYVDNLVWKYGSYHRLSLLKSTSVVEKLIIEFPTKKYTEEEFTSILKYFENKPFSYFHNFYFLYSLKNAAELKSKVLIPEEELFKVSEAFLYQFESSPYWPTIHIRWIIFLFHIYSKEWKKAVKMMQYIGYYQDSFFGTLLYNRALFYSNDKDTAYNNIESLLKEKPDDLLLLHEMVLYNYYLGNKEKAKELLKKVRKTTKQDTIIIKTKKMFQPTDQHL